MQKDRWLKQCEGQTFSTGCQQNDDDESNYSSS